MLPRSRRGRRGPAQGLVRVDDPRRFELETSASRLYRITAGSDLLTDDALEVGLDRCFDAVVRPEDWPAAMASLAEALGASGGCFNPNDGTADRLRLPASIRYRDMLAEFVGEGWASQDLRARRGLPMARAGRRILVEDDLTTSDERARTPIYIDLFARHGMEMFASVNLPIAEQLWTLSLVRSDSDGPFAREEAARMLRARPSLRRLLLFATEVSNSAGRGALAALEHVAVAAVIVARNGHVAQVNPPAQALLGQGLDLRSGRLTAPDQASNAALEALIAAAGGLSEPVCIQRPDRDPLIVEAVPMKGDRADIFGASGVLLLITDTSARPVPALDLLRRAFGLTGREGIAAQHLAKGEAIVDIAEHLQLRQSSVRQIVKSVLDKTETRR